MSIANNYFEIKKHIPNQVKLVAVSKMNSVERIMELYQEGHKIFGENKVQELVPKAVRLPKDMEWHFIGHLQTNKVKYIAPFISFIHSVDSLKLLKEIDKEAKKNNRIIPCLLEFHIASEETKYGLTISEAIEILNSEEFMLLNNVVVAGVMGMATFTEDLNQVRNEFKNLKNIFNEIKINLKSKENSFKEISMGMSNDFQIAIEEGSTMVRVGSSIFK